jgi:phosphohistidine swiveling domain-containing protein
MKKFFHLFVIIIVIHTQAIYSYAFFHLRPVSHKRSAVSSIESHFKTSSTGQDSFFNFPQDLDIAPQLLRDAIAEYNTDRVLSIMEKLVSLHSSASVSYLDQVKARDIIREFFLNEEWANDYGLKDVTYRIIELLSFSRISNWHEVLWAMRIINTVDSNLAEPLVIGLIVNLKSGRIKGGTSTGDYASTIISSISEEVYKYASSKKNFYLASILSKYLPYDNENYLQLAWGISEDIDEVTINGSRIVSDIRELVHGGRLSEGLKLVNAYIVFLETGNMEGLGRLWVSQKINEEDLKARDGYTRDSLNPSKGYKDVVRLRTLLDKVLNHHGYSDIIEDFKPLFELFPVLEQSVLRLNELYSSRDYFQLYVESIILSGNISQIIFSLDDGKTEMKKLLIELNTRLDSLKFTTLKNTFFELQRDKNMSRKIRLLIQLASATSRDLSTNMGLLSKRIEEFSAVLEHPEALTVSQMNNVLHVLIGECNSFIDFYNISWRPIVIKVLGGSAEDHEGFLNALIRRDLFQLAQAVEIANYLLNITGKKRVSQSRLGMGRYKPSDKGNNFILLSDLSNLETWRGRLLYGNKPLGCAYMLNSGINVPDGFLIPANYPQDESHMDNMDFAFSVLEALARLQTKLFNNTGKVMKFGDPDNPLIVSARGASMVHMPGIMPTVVNLGLTDEIVDRLASKEEDPWYIYDAYRRFIKSYSVSVLGISENKFIEIIDRIKQKEGVRFKTELSISAMKKCIETYKGTVAREGLGAELEQALSSPLKALLNTIKSIKDTWHSAEVKQFCKAFNISPDNDVSIVVQRMVYGNKRLPDSGDPERISLVGACNSRSLGSNRRLIEGKYKISAQGDDLMSAYVTKDSIKDLNDMQKEHPAIYDLLNSVASYMDDFYRAPVSLEFTVEDGVLYILQVIIPFYSKASLQAVSTDEEPLALGIGIGGEPIVGTVVFEDSDFKRLIGQSGVKKAMLILDAPLPSYTGIALKSDGIIANRGSEISHLAVTAKSNDIAGVFGCGHIKIRHKSRRCIIGGQIIREGDILTIDPASGAVYLGEQSIVPFEQAKVQDDAEALSAHHVSDYSKHKLQHIIFSAIKSAA